jgi:hypothetical protein
MLMSEKLGEQEALDDWPYRLRIARVWFKEDQGDLDGALDLLADSEKLQPPLRYCQECAGCFVSADSGRFHTRCCGTCRRFAGFYPGDVGFIARSAVFRSGCPYSLTLYQLTLQALEHVPSEEDWHISCDANIFIQRS